MTVLDMLGIKAVGFKRRFMFSVFITRFFGSTLRYNKRKPFFTFFIFCGVVLITLGSIKNHKAVENFENFLLDLSGPLVSGIQAPVHFISDKLSFLKSHNELVSEIDYLKYQNKALNQELLGYKQQAFIQHEHYKTFLLQKSLRNQQIITSHGINVAVLTFSHPGQSFLISTENSGNTVQNHIVLGEKGLIGRVTRCGKTTAQVTSLNSIDSRVPVDIHGCQAILVGENGKVFLTHLKESIHDFKIGDAVVTSGYGGVFPKGLPIGTISKIDNDRIEITLLENASHRHSVFLVPPVMDATSPLS